MRKIKNKTTLLNMISTLLFQVVTIISMLVLPRIVIYTFGSNVNGLISSLTQFLNYINLIEGGVTGVIIASLYKPLVSKDNTKINSILVSTRNFYLKIGMVFIIYSLCVGIAYPFIFNTSFSFPYIFFLTQILSLKLLIQYMFSLTLKTLLQADKKIYIVSNTNSILLIVNMIAVYITAKLIPNVHFLKFIEGISFIAQPIIYKKYVDKYYKLDKNVKEDKELVKNRWNGLSVNIAAFIHTNTDVTILSIFTSLTTVSVYSVYSLVTSGFKQIISALSSGISATIGQSYAKGNKDDLIEKFDLFEYIIFFASFLLYSVGAILITPFVLLYTKNIVDANYNQAIFGFVLVLAEFFYIIKYPHLTLAYNANKFKEIKYHCYMEAIINIVISLLLVNRYGLLGVAIGTLVAMIYRMIFHVYFTTKIMNRSQMIFYSRLFVFGVFTMFGFMLCYTFFPILDLSVVSWLFHGFIYTWIFTIIYILMSIIFYKKELKKIINYIVKK